MPRPPNVTSWYPDLTFQRGDRFVRRQDGAEGIVFSLRRERFVDGGGTGPLRYCATMSDGRYEELLCRLAILEWVKQPPTEELRLEGVGGRPVVEERAPEEAAGGACAEVLLG